MKPLHFILINTNILASITIMYGYWLLGGKNSLEYFFPAKSSSRKEKIRPNKWMLFFVFLLMLAMTWLCVEQIESFFINPLEYPEVFLWGNRAISIIFILRAIGNFTYIGFTKTFKKGTFAKLDTYLYSPICLVVALCSYMLEFLG